MVDSAKLWARHNEVVVFVEFNMSIWLFNIFFNELVHPCSFIWIAISFNLYSILAPSINKRSPEKICI
jgi:hypothetical protein